MTLLKSLLVVPTLAALMLLPATAVEAKSVAAPHPTATHAKAATHAVARKGKAKHHAKPKKHEKPKKHAKAHKHKKHVRKHAKKA